MLRIQQVIFGTVLFLGLATGAVLLASPGEFETAVAELGEPDGTVRVAAIEQLADLGPTRLDDLLDELAADHTPLQVAGLAEAIRRIGIGASDVPDVSSLLDEDSPSTRHAAISILALQAASARDALERVAATESEPAAVRAAAALALRDAGAQARAALRGLVADEDAPEVVRRAALGSLAQVSIDGAGDVASLATDADQPWSLRRAAILALGDPSAPGDTPLATLLGSRDAKVRETVIEAMVARGATANVTLVAGRLADPSADARYAALRGLTHLGAATANRTAVIGRMLDADPRVQALAAEVTGRTCRDIATTVRPSLVSLLASTNFNVRCKAALALYAHGDKSGAPTMRADAKSTNPSIALQAGQAYSQITGQ